MKKEEEKLKKNLESMTIWESSTLRKRLMLILILKQFNF